MLVDYRTEIYKTLRDNLECFRIYGHRGKLITLKFQIKYRLLELITGIERRKAVDNGAEYY